MKTSNQEGQAYNRILQKKGRGEDNLKMIHIADTHLGASAHQNNSWQMDRKKELWQALEQVVLAAESEQVDLLLIAGDMFHRQPLLRELKELNYIFSHLTHTKVVFIAGNHDYMKTNSYYRTFEWEKHVYYLKGSQCESIYFEDLNTEIYGLSYDNYEIRESRYDDIIIKDKKRINILLAHGGDEKHIPFSKTTLGTKGFDYIALGHIHVPQILISNKMAYAGALEPVDIGDEGVHGYFVVEVDEKGTNLTFRKSAKREYKVIKIQSDSSFTNRKLQDTIQDTIQKMNEPNYLWKIMIIGYRDEEISYDMEAIYSIDKVVSVIDLTEPDYDFDKLQTEYARSIIGKYIQTMRSKDMTDIQKKALYYGVKAMLDEMG